MIYPKEHWLTDDERGIQMPWYTRPCLDVIDKWDLRGKYVYEYGVGYSTLWFKSRGAICSGVDVNKEWIELACSKGIDRGIHHSEMENFYIENILMIPAVGGYDIVVVDGNFRDKCTYYAMSCLKPGGKLILDNWLQPEVEEFWPKTEELIKDMPIEIYKEPEHKFWQTAIVTKP